MKDSKDDLLKIFAEKCAQYNLRVTPQRFAIYQEISKAKDHPSALILYKRVRKVLPNISFDTVYRTVLTFSGFGIVELVEGYGEEKRFEVQTQPHHHFRCIRCRRIIDLYSDDFDAVDVPKSIRSKYTIVRKRVHLEGICDRCKK